MQWHLNKGTKQGTKKGKVQDTGKGKAKGKLMQRQSNAHG
jgi:hypothetical protein